MKIFIDKPKNLIEPSNGSFLDNEVTWSDPNYTWSDINVNWGGFYGSSDEGPKNSRIELTKPVNSVVLGEKPI